MMSIVRTASIALIALAAAKVANAAPTETVLYSTHIGSIAGPVVRDSNGTLYGAMFFQKGYIYSLTPPVGKDKASRFRIIYSFKNNTDGESGPWSLVLDKTGALYGVTLAGGTYKVGVVFKLTPPSTGGTTWTETVLQNLESPDRAYDIEPSSLILAANGALYGTAQTNFKGGGSCGGTSCGFAFELLPPKDGGTAWRYKTLYVFQGGADGFNPGPALARNAQGALFGVTESGGIDGCAGFDTGCGTVFELALPTKGQTAWTKTTLYSFTGGADGGMPTGSLAIGKDGTLYGSAADGGVRNTCTINAGGCGVAFKLTPPATGTTSWTQTVLHAFQCSPDGAYPSDGFTLGTDGSLVGTVPTCGAATMSAGAIIKLTPPKGGQIDWTLQTIFSFVSGGGLQPNTKLARDPAGNFYGTTNHGGTTNKGTVFEVTK